MTDKQFHEIAWQMFEIGQATGLAIGFFAFVGWQLMRVIFGRIGVAYHQRKQLYTANVREAMRVSGGDWVRSSLICKYVEGRLKRPSYGWVHVCLDDLADAGELESKDEEGKRYVRARPGFTLIELLVVCFIGSMLMGLSFAGVAAVRRHCVGRVQSVTRKFDDMARAIPDLR